MRRNCLRYARCLACLALVLLPFHPVFGQSSPAITNVTMVGSPSLTFPPLAPGSTAVILGTDLADSTVSAAPPQSLVGGIEVHLVGVSGEVVAGLTYVSPTGISFVVPSMANGPGAAQTRVVIVKNGQRFDDAANPVQVRIGALNIESSPNPALFDQPVTLTAHVTTLQVTSLYGVYFGPGSVTFLDGATPLATINLSNVITYVDTPPQRRYDVSFTTSTLAAGTHSISASYSGDHNNPPSTSGVITQNVQTPQVTISSTPNPSLFGQTVSLIATVSPSTCAGSMVFFDETDQLGTVTLDRGRALLQTAGLPVGNHPITVRYSGDGTCPAVVYGPANDFTYRITSQTVLPFP